MNEETAESGEPRSDLAEHLYRTIRERYVDSQACHRLPSERKLVTELGASRMVIRVALDHLEQEGLIYQLPGGRIRYVRKAAAGAATAATRDPFDAPHPFHLMAADRAVTLRLMVMDLCQGTAQSVVARWEEWVRAFEKENTAVRVELVPWVAVPGDREASMRTVDVVEMPPTLLRDLPGDLFEDLSFCMEADRPFRRRKFMRSLWADGCVGRQVCMIPFGAALPCIGMNADWWNRYAGRPVPAGWTWSEFEEVGERMVAASGRPFFSLTGVSDIMLSCGFDPAAPHAQGGAQHALERLLEMRNILHIATKMVSFHSIVEGQAACRTASIASIPQLEESFGKKILILPYPCDEGGRVRRTTLGLGMTTTCHHPVEAWELIKFLSGLPQQRALGTSHHLIPAFALTHTRFRETPCELGDVGFFFDALERSCPSPWCERETEELETRILGPEVYALFHGQRDIPETAYRLRLQLLRMAQRCAGEH